MSQTPRLLISEIFGPTIQGEGPDSGTLSTFVRLAGCNLRCVWCDSRYAYTDRSLLPIGRVYQEISRRSSRHLVITGGEPLLQSGLLMRFLDSPVMRSWEIEIETNGTCRPLVTSHPDVRYRVSPKMSNSGSRRSLRGESLLAFLREPQYAFKFVVSSHDDLDEVFRLQQSISIPSSKVWIMPLGVISREISRISKGLIDNIIYLGYNYSPRLQVTLWGKRRGV